MAHQDPVHARRNNRGEQTPMLGQHPAESRPCIIVSEQAVRDLHPPRTKGELGRVMRPYTGPARTGYAIGIPRVCNASPIRRAWSRPSGERFRWPARSPTRYERSQGIPVVSAWRKNKMKPPLRSRSTRALPCGSFVVAAASPLPLAAATTEKRAKMASIPRRIGDRGSAGTGFSPIVSLTQFTRGRRPSRRSRSHPSAPARYSVSALTRAVRRRSSWVSTQSAVLISATGSGRTRTRPGEVSPR